MAYGSGLMDVVQSSTAGVAPQFNDGNGTQVGTLCRSWVNFGYVASAITVRASFNVSSVTRSSTGIYVVNFTNAMSDANYSVVTSTLNYAVGVSATATSSFTLSNFNTTTTASVDSTLVTASVFR